MSWLLVCSHVYRDRTIPFTVNLIGVYLVFASLILPALATIHTLTNSPIKAYGLSLSAFGIGLLMPYFWDLPSGPTIVVSMIFLAGIYFLLLIIISLSKLMDCDFMNSYGP